MPAKGTILIVDDDPLSCETLEALLSCDGYQLEFVNNGAAGLARAAEIKPDVLLLDVMMPLLDGFEVCRRIRQDPFLEEMPVVLITSLDDEDSRLQGLEAGADDFISKPYNRSELRARLRTIVRLNRYRRLQTERARFAWIVDHAQDGYVILDDSDKIVYTNPQARLYLGIDAGVSVQSATFLEIARRQYSPQPETAWASWPAPVSGPRFLVRPETATAAAFWLQVECGPGGMYENLGRVIQLRNITEQVSSFRDIRKFHTMVEHKLRTPLAHLHMSLELLERRIARSGQEEAHKLIANALQGSVRLRAELDDVWQYIQAPVLAARGAGMALQQLQPLLGALCASLGVKKPALHISRESEQKRLTLSPSALELVLGELLENARKFHPRQDPAVEISVRPLSDAAVEICIQDDGITLSPQQLIWAWEPYVQGEKYLTGETSGMGLGLPLVSTVVWQVGGTAHLHNRSDQPGVVVSLVLPLSGE